MGAASLRVRMAPPGTTDSFATTSARLSIGAGRVASGGEALAGDAIRAHLLAGGWWYRAPRAGPENPGARAAAPNRAVLGRRTCRARRDARANPGGWAGVAA